MPAKRLITTAESNGLVENPWGYAKRLSFVVDSVRRQFPGRAPSTITVLDVGCGNGSQLALPLSKLGYAVVGVDPDERSISNARANASTNATFHCCLLDALPFRSYDVVLLSEVLEHLENPLCLLSSCVRYLSAAGLLVVTVPNGVGEFEVDNYLFRTLRLESLIAPFRRHRPAMTSSDNQAGHVQFFRLRHLKRLFAVANLEVVWSGSAPLACGQLAVYAFNWLPKRALRINAKITDWLPMAMASGWYFGVRKNQPESGATIQTRTGTCNGC